MPSTPLRRQLSYRERTKICTLTEIGRMYTEILGYKT